MTQFFSRKNSLKCAKCLVKMSHYFYYVLVGEIFYIHTVEWHPFDLIGNYLNFL